MKDMRKMKDCIRNEILLRRDSLSEDEILSKSGSIFSKLVSSEKFENSRFIMVYSDFRKEVSTRCFIEECIASGKRVALPLVYNDGPQSRGLWACEIADMEKELEVGKYGILEPKKQEAKIVNPLLLDMVIVPGVVFGLNRFRIGYGAGYYDRFLCNVSKACLKVGVAFEIQVVESVPAEEHDIPLDMIITEERIIG